MDTALIDRRSLLLGGFAAGVALVTAGAITLPSAAPGFRALSDREHELVAAIAETLFPKGPFPLDGVEAGVVAKVDAYVADGTTDVASVGFRYVLRALELGTLAAWGRRFVDLTLAERAEVLDTWAEPGVLPRRVAFDAIKMVFGMAYFSHGEVQAHMGYRSTCGGGVT